MRIHGVMTAKNEADVIGNVLEAATRWCDFIYVYDNGSVDGTWDIVQDLARRHACILPVRRSDAPYTQLLRAEILGEFAERLRPGDWWCKLDADEIYIDRPRTFLERVPPEFDVIYGSSFQFYFTDRDLERWEREPEAYAASVPVEERLRWYRNNHSEPRFARLNRPENWRAGNPTGRRTFPIRIWLKHYQYRSPEQIQRRIEDRLEVARRGAGFRHEGMAGWGRSLGVAAAAPREGLDWRGRIVPAARLDFRADDDRWVSREAELRPLPLPAFREDLRGGWARLKLRMERRRQDKARRVRFPTGKETA